MTELGALNIKTEDEGSHEDDDNEELVRHGLKAFEGFQKVNFPLSPKDCEPWTKLFFDQFWIN